MFALFPALIAGRDLVGAAPGFVDEPPLKAESLARRVVREAERKVPGWILYGQVRSMTARIDQKELYFRPAGHYR